MSNLVDRLLDLTVRIQQTAAPTFKEQRRAQLVRGLFAGEDLQDIMLDSDNNVFARFPGRDRINPLIVSAHLDTVFASSTPSVSRDEGRICGPGIGDNALGIAALFGLIWSLRQHNADLAADVWFAANSCEEGLGDLRGMKAVVDRFGAHVAAYLVIEGTALGQVFHRAVGVQRYRITVHTAGGHSWSDYGQPSAIHELAAVVAQLTSLPLPVSPRTTLNVGMMSGGTGINVLASNAQLELDLRSEDADALHVLVAQVDECVQSRRREGVEIEMELIGQRPAGEIPVDHPLVRLAAECLHEQDVVPRPTAGSTDANIPLSRGFPAIVLGVTTGGGGHTPAEYIDIAPVAKGMHQLVRFVERLLGPQPPG